MAEPPPYPESGDDTGTPPWVKVSGIVVGVVVLLVVIMLLAGHGPGRHMPRADTPPSSVTEPGVQQP